MTAPELTRLQLAWLQEIGIDRRLLSHYALQDLGYGTVPEPAAIAAAEPATVVPVLPAGADRPAPHENPLRRAGGLILPGLTSGRAKSPAPIEEAPYVRAPMSSNWQGLQSQVEECRACALQSGRGSTVFGSGAVEAPQLMVIGEAPGGSDDRAGQPFQGKAGTLLKAMLAAAGLDSETAYYSNLLKCRPLGNRPPTPEEAEACMPFLQRQIALAKPRQILAMGIWAAKALLRVDQEIDELRGRVHVIRSESGEDIKMVVTHHPTALLLRPQHKADAWRDLLLLRGLVQEPR